MGGSRQIAVAGAGYVGLTSAACFCAMGHQVRLVEINPDRLSQLQAGQCPIYEPGLADLLGRYLGGRLQVTGELAEAVRAADTLFVCVGTPPLHTGRPDLTALRHLLTQVAALPDLADLTVVIKSTVPPGTNRLASRMLGQRVPVVSNPEFLRESSAIADFFHPDRMVVGSPDVQAALRVAGLYRGVEAPLLVTGWEEAELVKYVTNGFLAMKVSLANEIAALCDSLGVEAMDVLEGLGLDHRVGPHFLKPGPGYGGSCLPKDLDALIWKARRLRVRLDLLPAVRRANRRQRNRLLERLSAGLRELSGRRVAVWGLAFKAGTDDLRGGASLDLIPRLLEAGAKVVAHDPAALDAFALLFPPDSHPGLHLVRDHWEAVAEADALLILTEWDLYRQASPEQIRRTMAGNLVIDGRNLLMVDQALSAGLRYRGIGRALTAHRP